MQPPSSRLAFVDIMEINLTFANFYIRRLQECFSSKLLYDTNRIKKEIPDYLSFYQSIYAIDDKGTAHTIRYVFIIITYILLLSKEKV